MGLSELLFFHQGTLPWSLAVVRLFTQRSVFQACNNELHKFSQYSCLCLGRTNVIFTHSQFDCRHAVNYVLVLPSKMKPPNWFSFFWYSFKLFLLYRHDGVVGAISLFWHHVTRYSCTAHVCSFTICPQYSSSSSPSLLPFNMHCLSSHVLWYVNINEICLFFVFINYFYYVLHWNNWRIKSSPKLSCFLIIIIIVI